jgi:hypothetical protein
MTKNGTFFFFFFKATNSLYVSLCIPTTLPFTLQPESPLHRWDSLPSRTTTERRCEAITLAPALIVGLPFSICITFFLSHHLHLAQLLFLKKDDAGLCGFSISPTRKKSNFLCVVEFLNSDIQTDKKVSIRKKGSIFFFFQKASYPISISRYWRNRKKHLECVIYTS